MKSYSIKQANRQLGLLIDQAAAGEEIIICKDGVPAARLTSLKPTGTKVRYGTLKGKGTVADDFDAPLPPHLLSTFEGG